MKLVQICVSDGRLYALDEIGRLWELIVRSGMPWRLVEGPPLSNSE